MGSIFATFLFKSYCSRNAISMCDSCIIFLLYSSLLLPPTCINSHEDNVGICINKQIAHCWAKSTISFVIYLCRGPLNTWEDRRKIAGHQTSTLRNKIASVTERAKPLESIWVETVDIVLCNALPSRNSLYILLEAPCKAYGSTPHTPARAAFLFRYWQSRYAVQRVILHALLPLTPCSWIISLSHFS